MTALEKRSSGPLVTRFKRLPLGFQLLLGLSVPFGVSMGVFFTLLGAPLFGVASGSLSGVATALGLGLLIAVVSGLFYGLMMTAFLSVTQVLFSSKFGAREASNSVHHVQTVLVAGSPGVVHQRVRAAMERHGVGHYSRDEVDVIKGRTGLSLKSFGEIVTATITLAGDNCEVVISSSPRLKTTLVDYGKNRDNVERIAKDLLG